MEMAVRKWEKAANKVKTSDSVAKKVNRNTTKHRWAHTTLSNIKWARKFHIVVVQNNVKEMYKKGAAHLQGCFFFFANREEKSYVTLP